MRSFEAITSTAEYEYVELDSGVPDSHNNGRYSCILEMHRDESNIL
jgi:hypothetical protein